MSHEFILYRQQHEPRGQREKAKLNAVMADDAAQQARGIKKKEVVGPKKKMMKEPIKEKEIKMEASFQKPDMKKMVREYSKKGDAYQAKMQKGPPPKEEYEEDFGFDAKEEVVAKAAVMNNRKQLGYRPKIEDDEGPVKRYSGDALEMKEEPVMKYTNDGPILEKEEPKMQYTDDGPISEKTEQKLFHLGSMEEKKSPNPPPLPVSKKEMRTDDGNKFKKSVVNRNVGLEPWEKHEPVAVPGSKRGVRPKK